MAESQSTIYIVVLKKFIFVHKKFSFLLKEFLIQIPYIYIVFVSWSAFRYNRYNYATR